MLTVDLGFYHRTTVEMDDSTQAQLLRQYYTLHTADVLLRNLPSQRHACILILQIDMLDLTICWPFSVSITFRCKHLEHPS